MALFYGTLKACISLAVLGSQVCGSSHSKDTVIFSYCANSFYTIHKTYKKKTPFAISLYLTCWQDPSKEGVIDNDIRHYMGALRLSRSDLFVFIFRSSLSQV